MDQRDIDNRFAFHPADTQEKQDLHAEVRSAAGSAANLFNEILPEGREKSTAMTKLEEAMFWANASLARPPLPQGDQAR